MQLLHLGPGQHLCHFPGSLASRACLASLSLGILDTRVVVFSEVEVIRYSGLFEFHSCALCCKVSHQVRNEGGTMPRAPNHWGVPKSLNDVASYFFSAVHLLPK